jgi:hypothetical protein
VERGTWKQEHGLCSRFQAAKSVKLSQNQTVLLAKQKQLNQTIFLATPLSFIS